MKNKKFLILVSTSLLIGLFIAGSMFYKGQERKRIGFLAKDNAEIFVRDYSPRMGSADAKVYLVEFLDPECESCSALYPSVKKLMEDYQGKIQLVIRYAPFHGNSQFAIKILEAARKQDQYWETLELLFRYQPQWGSHHHPQPELIWNYLPSLGLDLVKLRKDMEDPQLLTIIEQDKKDGQELGVRMTPTFFVNGKPLEKFGLNHLQDAIEAELAD